MNLIAALFASAFLASSSLAGPGDNLPNDCVITATEALARLSMSAKWVRVLDITFVSAQQSVGALPSVHRHCMTVWQISDKGPTCIYDHSGTIILKAHSRDLQVIVAEMNKMNPAEPIIASRFLE